jgi:hypothetical protein
MVKKNYYGIKLIFTPQKRRGAFYAEFYISKGVNSKDFLSNYEIIEAIKECQQRNRQKVEGRRLGRITYRINGDTAIRTDYYPVELAEEIFTGKNIANLLERRTRRALKKSFPKVELLKGWETSNRVIEQQKKREITNPTYRYDYYARKLDAEISRKRAKLMKKRPKRI